MTTHADSIALDLEAFVDDVIHWLEALEEEPSGAVSKYLRKAMGSLCEALLNIQDREVSAAEGTLTEILRSVVHTLSAPSTAASLDDLRAALRRAVVDLDHGLDGDVDNVGCDLSDVVLWLHTELENPSGALDERIADVFLVGASEIERCRNRDLAAQAFRSGPIEVHRRGAGPVLLAAGVKPMAVSRRLNTTGRQGGAPRKSSGR